MPDELRLIATVLPLTQKFIPYDEVVWNKSPTSEFCMRMFAVATALLVLAAVNVRVGFEPFTLSL